MAERKISHDINYMMEKMAGGGKRKMLERRRRKEFLAPPMENFPFSEGLCESDVETTPRTFIHTRSRAFQASPALCSIYQNSIIFCQANSLRNDGKALIEHLPVDSSRLGKSRLVVFHFLLNFKNRN